MPVPGFPLAVSSTCVVNRPTSRPPDYTVFYSSPGALTTTTMASADRYPRDLIGYGARPPHARWPGGARIAVQFVLNYEEGGENCVLHGDATSEQFLSEIVGAAAYPDRHMSMEGIYEYGSTRARPRALAPAAPRRRRGAAPARAHAGGVPGAPAPSGAPARLRRPRPRDRLPRLALDPLPGHRRGHRARAYAHRHADHQGADGRPAAGRGDT